MPLPKKRDQESTVQTIREFIEASGGVANVTAIARRIQRSILFTGRAIGRDSRFEVDDAGNVQWADDDE